MKWISIGILLALYFVNTRSQSVTCGKGKTSKTVKIDANEKFAFKTQKGKKYLGSTTCVVNYKLGKSCKAMKFQCTKSNLISDKKCKKGDKITIITGGKSKRYCKTKKPKAVAKGKGKKGMIKVVFKSDKDKKNKKTTSTGSVCRITCTAKKTAPAPITVKSEIITTTTTSTTTTTTTTSTTTTTIATTSQLTQVQINNLLRRSRPALANSRPAAVRLTFHDCVGGCNGCLNVNNSDNKGLENLVADIETIYQDNSFSEIVSRADLWALLGIWSINQTIIKNNEDCTLYGPNGTEASTPNNHSYENCQMVPELDVTFKWGREDCSTAPYSNEDVGLPLASFNQSELMEFFSDEFDFNSREVTALMGVHTLGQADIFNSGFHGTWVNNEQAYFNNQYFKNMATLDWNLVQRPCTTLTSVDSQLCDGETTGWQWVVGGTGFNLNADMALFKDFNTDSDGKPSCTYATCPLSSTASDVEEFAASNTVWIEDFSKVYTKMLAHGSDLLNDVN